MPKYRIRAEDMNKSLRLIGSAARFVSPEKSEKVFRMENRALDLLVKGRWPFLRTRTKTVWIPREDGTRLRALVATARRGTKAKATGLLWIHGGGYAIGLPEQDAVFVNGFCRDGSCVALLPDYTRSVDAPYPAALNDCYLALRWLYDHAEELGIDPSQIFVGGDSAGGGLTAALSILARDRGEVPVAFQMPLYPMLDDREETPSSQENDEPVWDTTANRVGWSLYLRSLKGTVPAYAAPARLEDYSGLPPTCTYVGTIEPFHDETVLYCEALRKAGIPVHFKEYEGCFHGFDMLAYPTKPAREARDFLMETFRFAQENYFASLPVERETK